MSFDMNYVFWVDATNAFTAALTAARDYEIREKTLSVKYPQLQDAQILSHRLDSEGVY